MPRAGTGNHYAVAREVTRILRGGDYARGTCVFRVAVAQRTQRQARPNASAGNAARASGEITTLVHQHGVSNEPDAAGAHSLALPQRGHWLVSTFMGLCCPDSVNGE